ncbi:Protein kinase domain [Macleaya cordata]|uniref:non-specific serine/threonine protein kinase n=1 Tax=Macleaya cordata TaxID=56857 RepID=A0A200Q8Z3_MACCD|nr:Protein kinase domain [Macleaya cordata]
MWNNITGSIPTEIGNIASLELLLLNGNQFSGSLPDEIGLLTKLKRLQVDENQLSGPIPISFANLTSVRHLHLNNNSFSGQIPSELSKLPNILHLLLDNNNFTGYLPPEFSNISSLRILQLDNNHFDGSEIPASYGSTKLLKLSLRNCSLQGAIPDLSRTTDLHVLDLSWNQLSGSIPLSKLSDNMTTIDLSNNNLNGSIPANFSELPNLQKLSLENNFLSGSVPSTLWQNMNFSAFANLTLDFRNNSLSNIFGDTNPPRNVTLRLHGNPLCSDANANVVQFCGSVAGGDDTRGNSAESSPNCAIQKCPADYFFAYAPASQARCFCAAPLSVAYRLKSPSFSYFPPYERSFVDYMAENLRLEPFQLSVYSYGWEEGPRLWMNLTIFLLFDNNSTTLNTSEVLRIKGKFTTWSFPPSDTFGPYDLLDYPDRPSRDSNKVSISKGALAGIILGTIALSVTISAIIAIIIIRKRYSYHHVVSRNHLSSRISIKIDGVKGFTFKELKLATENFNSSTEVGQGGYGKVYKGTLTDQTNVAIKRAQVGSLQGEKEFLTEIELLSRLHHRNLVGLLGYCDEEGEQMLIYEFMANGSLRDWLSAKSKESLSFPMRLRIALGSAKGILYLHTEADPPIFHRDIKASNILLDSKLTAKVADFGLSRLAPVEDDEGTLPGHVSTVVKGTPGYLDPEYFLTHKLTDKSDVYSLGVVFLELLTGMPPISFGKNIVREVNLAHKSGNIFSIVDSKMGSYPAECLAEFILLALRCCQDKPQARPSMLEIVRDLEKMLSMTQESGSSMLESESEYSERSALPSSSSTSYVTRDPLLSSSDIYGSDLISGKKLKNKLQGCKLDLNVLFTLSVVNALRAIKNRLIDPLKHLKSWKKGDPCNSNWTGILCFNTTGNDGYQHVQEVQLLNMNLSGTLAPEVGQLLHIKIIDFMWNNISGSIPREIGNITSLELLLLSGNKLSGSLPDEIGYLPNLDRIQVDQNCLSGPIPKSWANLNRTKHFHMNNNSFSGQIPPELSRLPIVAHFLLDNNNLSGYLPPEFSTIPTLLILQLDNNQFKGSEIPASYGNLPKLVKLSLRNCSLQGPVPDLSRIPDLHYIDLSWNKLIGPIPSNRLSNNITTVILSGNNLNGSIPSNFSGLPHLQRLSLENNQFSNSVPSNIWQNMTFSPSARLVIDFRNNSLSKISGALNPPNSVTIRLLGNPVCSSKNELNIVQFCGSETGNDESPGSSDSPRFVCSMQSCPEEGFFEYVPESPAPCFCAAPLRIGFRLKSPSISDFPPYRDLFEVYITTALDLDLYQLSIDSFIWEEGPRLNMYLKLFPMFNNHSSTFNSSEILRIRSIFTMWTLTRNNLFGPYELLNFTLLGPYSNVVLESSKSGISKGGLAGIILGALACAITISAVVGVLITKRQAGYQKASRRHLSKMAVHIKGLKSFSFGEMALATNNFSDSTQVGRGGYGKVYKGILADKTVVAIKKAQEGSLQGENEFFTEIELLSRLHHRNLVSLVGYCHEDEEQMLIYQFMPNGTLRDCLSAKSKEPLSFAMRLRIALGSAKGILYLHTEADPPIFHRDIKATNILLDTKYTAKVADFGLSRLAPIPDCEGVIPGHVSTIVKGTPGYLDPEYFLTRKLTDKSDVYSLGVVFLELLTGMHPITHGKNIIREVNVAYQSGIYFAVIDNRMGCYHPQCVEKFMKLALSCCQDETDARPPMMEVVRELESIWRLLSELETSSFDLTVTDIESDEVVKNLPPFPSSSTTTENRYSGQVITSSSSFSTRNPNASTDISGSDLLSDIDPMIKPR